MTTVNNAIEEPPVPTGDQKSTSEGSEQKHEGETSKAQSPKSIDELPEQLQDQLEIIKDDPINFGRNFKKEHADYGTSRKSDAEKSQLEAIALSHTYISLLEQCGGENAPADAKELLLNSIKSALGARGINAESHNDVIKVANGPREDRILEVFGAESRLGSQLSELFDPADGMLRRPEDLSLSQALRALGETVDTGPEIFGKLESLEECKIYFSNLLNRQVEVINSFLDGRGLEGEDRRNLVGIVSKGIDAAYQVIANAANAHYEHSDKDIKNKEETETAKPEPQAKLNDKKSEEKQRDQKDTDAQDPSGPDSSPNKVKGKLSFDLKNFGKKAFWGYVVALGVMTAAPALGAGVGLGYLAYLGFQIYRNLKRS